MSVHLTDADRIQIRSICNRATVRGIVASVAQMSGLAPSAIKGPCRQLEFVQARDVVCFIAHREGISYSQIARELNRDHTTIMAAVRREAARRGEASA